MDEEVLIKHVKQYPLLFDKGSIHFKNAKMKETIWENISIQMQHPVEECQRVYRNLREKFSRERSFCKPSGRISKWALYDTMLFLDKHVLNRKRKSKMGNIKKVETVRESPPSSNSSTQPSCIAWAWEGLELKDDSSLKEFAIPNGGDADNELIEFQIEPETVPEPEIKSESMKTRPKRQRKDELPEATIENAVTKISEYVSRKSMVDSDVAFGNYVGLALQEMPKATKNIAKRQIMNILTELSDELNI